MKILKYSLMLACSIMVTNVHAVEFKATLKWSQRVELGTVVSGVVERIQVNVGQQVKKNQIMVKLDDSVLIARVAEFKAKLKSSDEALKEAERERERALKLYEQTVLSDHELQVAKNNYIAAKASFEHVKAQLAASQYKLKYSTIRAPFDAVVLHRNIQPGQVITTEFEQKPLLIIAASNKMLAVFSVSEEQLRNIAQNKTARVSIAGKNYNGKIISVGLESITGGSAPTFPVEVEFELDSLLRAGQTAKVEIE